MNATWIVSANSGKARFFAQEGFNTPLREISGLINDAARMKNADIDTDAQGPHAASRSRHSTGMAMQPSGYEPEQSAVQHLNEKFARNVVEYLQQAHNSGCFSQLCLVAAPEFLGTLRKVMNSGLQPLVTSEINKDYTQLNPKDLGARVREHNYG